MKAKIRIIFYREEKSSIGSVEFTSLRVIGERTFEEPLELGENPEEMLEKLARDTGDGDYVEAIAETKEGVIRVGVRRKGETEMQGSHILFHRPSKLLKIGIVQRDENPGDVAQRDREPIVPVENMISPEDTDSGDVETANNADIEITQMRGALSEDNIVWYTPDTTIYVFEGYIRVNEPYEAVIFLTEDGEKIYTGSEGYYVKKVVRRSKKVKKRKRKK